jgi:hypothetical protein
LAAWLLCAAIAHGQVSEKQAELQRTLAKLGEAAVELERSLPSFTCEESVVSQELRGEKVKRSLSFTAMLRAQRQPDGRLAESFQVTSVNGKPFTEGNIKTPVMASGGFDEALRYFHPDQSRCYDFQLSSGRIDFKTIPDGLAHGCKETGMVGFARLDDQGNVTYLERTVPMETARVTRLATFASVSFAPVTMGEKTYRLSSHLLAEVPQGKSLGRFNATYSNCRLFKSTVTIGPAEVMPEDSSASKP